MSDRATGRPGMDAKRMTESHRTTRTPKVLRTKRLVILLFLGAGLAAVALTIRYFFLTRPEGTGPAGPAVPRSAFEDIWSRQKVLLLGIGDSITAGFGSSKGHSYFERLASNPDDEFPEMRNLCLSTVLPKLESRNIAVSGTTSIQHVDMQLPKLEVHSADILGIVVMSTGGNDIIHNYGLTPPREGAMYGATLTQAQPWIEAFEQRLQGMIDRVESSFPGGCHIFLTNIYDPTDGVGDSENAGLPAWTDGLKILRAYNEVIARCARERSAVHLVNIHNAFLGHGIHCTQVWRDNYRWDDPHYWYFENLEDPNDRGHDAIRRLFLLEIARVFGAI